MTLSLADSHVTFLSPIPSHHWRLEATQKAASRDELLARAAQEDQTPDDSLSPEALKRKRNREKKRRERDGERKEKPASIATTRQKWWNGNRSALSSEDLEAMFAQDGRVHDQLYFMDHGLKVTADDIVPVSLKEGTVELVEFVKTYGVVHLGYISRNDLPPDVWSQPFWRNAELMDKLITENLQTDQYAKFGLLNALPDFLVVKFLTEKAKYSWQKAADLVGYHTSHMNSVSYQ